MTDIAPMDVARDIEAPRLTDADAAAGPLIAAATDRALEQWGRTAGNDLSAEQVQEPLRQLADLVRRAVAGGDTPIDDFPHSLPTRRLLEALQSAVLDVAEGAERGADGPRPTSRQLVATMRAIEHVRAAFERDASQRFMTRISAPDALQLLVEVAHDMRSPLGSILFLAERLRKGQSGSVTPIQERQLGLVYSAAFGLSSLASDVMELARGGERLLDASPIAFSVSELLRSVYDIVLPIAEEKGLGIRMTPPAADVRMGHPAALNRVLLNLTTNALKFTATGGVEVVVTQVSRSKVGFAVQDTGRGIPEPVLATLFDAFRRRQKPGDYYFSSAGLGLGICQTLVRRMGGELKVETELEKGTRFHFELELPVSRRI